MADSKSKLLLEHHIQYSKHYLRGSNLWNEIVVFVYDHELHEEFEDEKLKLLQYLDDETWTN